MRRIDLDGRRERATTGKGRTRRGHKEKEGTVLAPQTEMQRIAAPRPAGRGKSLEHTFLPMGPRRIHPTPFQKNWTSRRCCFWRGRYSKTERATGASRQPACSSSSFCCNGRRTSRLFDASRAKREKMTKPAPKYYRTNVSPTTTFPDARIQQLATFYSDDMT